MLKYTLDDATDWVFSAAFSPDSKLLASGSNDERIRVYGLGDGAVPTLGPLSLKTLAVLAGGLTAGVILPRLGQAARRRRLAGRRRRFFIF